MLSFARDIRPLFTQEDVDHMLRVDPSLDLGSYDSVKAHASSIYRRVSLGEMPPGKPWPQEQVAAFKQWMDEQHPL
jgi:tyrosinase